MREIDKRFEAHSFKVIRRTRFTRKEFKKVIMDVQVNMNNRPITYVEDELGPHTRLLKLSSECEGWVSAVGCRGHR